MNGVVAIAARPDEGEGPARRIVGFVRLLRDNGFIAGLRETRDALQLASFADLGTPQALRGGLRALLCASEGDWQRFDALFDAYWRGHGVKRAARVSGAGQRRESNQAQPDANAASSPWQISRLGAAEADAPTGGEGRRGGASSAESLAETDLRHIHDPEELARVHALAERLAARMKYRLTRREWRRRHGRRLDLRRVIHNSVRTGGMPIELAYRQRRPKPLRLVLILDASGSMSLYSAFFMRFIRGLLDNAREAEAFVFHTRLVHISPVMRQRDLTTALDRMALLAKGWGGGTRIGDSLKAFNDNYAAGAITSRTAVIVMSDGYDTGPAEVLDAEMARLKRRAKRIIWLNPLIGWKDYAPVARGMAAALPYVDVFAPAHNLESLAALEPVLERI